MGAYHHLADQIVFKDPAVGREAFLDLLRKSEDPTSLVEQKRLAVEARNLVKELGGEVEEDESLTLSITAGTRKHMKLGGASLVLFSGIKNDPDEDFIDVEESLKEISFQALDNNMHRGVPFDEEGIRMEWRGFGAAAQALDRLPDALRFEMQRSGKDPECFEDRVVHAEELVRKGPGGWDRLGVALAKSATNATAMDLMPSSQLKRSGGVTRCGILDIKRKLEAGASSLFNAVAHYGLRKKGPWHLLSGYRHIFVEAAMSRLVSSMDGQHLADICELVGLWGPNLFSYRKGFSSHHMVLAMRRCVYKTLEQRGVIYILDWDESGAFPKMQLGVMDDLLEVAQEELRDDMGVEDMDEVEGPGVKSSLMWKCGQHYDQFYRRQVIYPITEYGLGNPYVAEDGALEGDSSGPTVYQTCSAVRTACTGDDGCVRFAHQGKLIAVSEVVFSDDQRLLHRDKLRFEQLDRV